MSNEDVSVRSGEDESADLFPGRDSDAKFDRSDPVNDRTWGSTEKYTPKKATSDLSIESVNQRAFPARRK
jgi:hypothetical protein